MSFELGSLASALGESESGVSFAGRSLKLNSTIDVEPIVKALTNCQALQYFNLEGNTLGVISAKAIGNALEKHPELRRALWKDIFTGRMKTEIPQALQYLSEGLINAGTHLNELDLSDNAFGPIGAEGLVTLLRSSSCYSLEVLKLNNNGLGTGGAKILASALKECYQMGKAQGRPLALKVFMAGRNRLEIKGTMALSEVFSLVKSLEVLEMPQNGISKEGITALSEAVAHNKNLKTLNLNDNTFGIDGSRAISNAIENLTKLETIDFGDCLMKTKGVGYLAEALASNHKNLKVLNLSGNEIGHKGAIAIGNSISGLENLEVLDLNANQLGPAGRDELRNCLKASKKLAALQSLEDDDSMDDEDDVEDEQDSDSEDDDSEDDPSISSDNSQGMKNANVAVRTFANEPTIKQFMAIGDDRNILFYNECLGSSSEIVDVNKLVFYIMKISSLYYSKSSKDEDVQLEIIDCCDFLYKQLFSWCEKNQKTTLISNTLFVHFGLIKSESGRAPWNNAKACIDVFESLQKAEYVPESAKRQFVALKELKPI